MASLFHPFAAEPNMHEPSPTKKPIIFKPIKVPTHKGDLVTTPFIFNKWVANQDTTWVTAATIFYTRVFGGALVEEREFMEVMHRIR